LVDTGNLVILLCGGDKSSQDNDTSRQKSIGRSIVPMRSFRTLVDVEESYFRDHPEEIDDYLTMIFEEYAKDSDTGALLSSLRVLSRVKGVTKIAEAAGMSRKGVQKALSESGNPEFASVNSIMHAMGYRLAPQKLEAGISS
jgi:probable addiction module antidote protein